MMAIRRWRPWPWRRGRCRSPRPARRRSPARPVLVSPAERGADLPAQRRARSRRLRSVERLADAEDRQRPVGQGGCASSGRRARRSRRRLAALRVAEDDVAGPARQHWRLISPVNAPFGSKYTFCAPTPIAGAAQPLGRWRAARRTAGRPRGRPPDRLESADAAHRRAPSSAWSCSSSSCRPRSAAHSSRLAAFGSVYSVSPGPGPRRRAARGLPGTPATRRRRSRCGSSCRPGRAARRPPPTRRRRSP